MKNDDRTREYNRRLNTGGSDRPRPNRGGKPGSPAGNRRGPAKYRHSHFEPRFFLVDIFNHAIKGGKRPVTNTDGFPDFKRNSRFWPVNTFFKCISALASFPWQFSGLYGASMISCRSGM